MILLKNNGRSYRIFNMTYRFSALKMFKLKMLFNFQKPVTRLLPMTSQWRFDAYSSPTRKISILIRLSATKTSIEFGREERKPTSSKVVFWLSAKSLRSTSWCRLVCFAGKGRLHFLEEKAKVDCAYYVATCFQISSKTTVHHIWYSMHGSDRSLQRRYPLDGILFQSGDICNKVAKWRSWKLRFSAPKF